MYKISDVRFIIYMSCSHNYLALITGLSSEAQPCSTCTTVGSLMVLWNQPN